MRSLRNWILVIGIFVIAGALGWYLGYNSGSMLTRGQTESLPIPGIGGAPDTTTTNENNEMSVLESRSADFRVQVQALLREHAVLAGDYLIKIYDEEDVSAEEQALSANSQNIANVIGNVYGQNARARFIESWEDHIDNYVRYTEATREDDQEAKANASESLTNISANMGQMFDDMNETPADRMDDLMREHIQGTIALVDAHAAENQGQVVQLKQAAYNQAGRMADYIVSVITTEKPDMFR